MKSCRCCFFRSFVAVLVINAPSMLLLLLLLISSTNGEQRIVEQPEDTVARAGDTVQLRCRVADQKGQVIWMKGDIGLGYKRDLPFWERMRMVGSLNDGEFHLEIRNVSLEDEETYQCQLSSSDDEPITKLSRRAKLNVLYEPTMPQLLGESGSSSSSTAQRTQPIVATEGHASRLSCQSRAGKPAARLSWALAEDRQAQKVIGHIVNWTAAAAHSNDQRTTMATAAGHPIRVREHLRPSLSNRSFRSLFGNISEEVVKEEDIKLDTITSHLNFVPTQAENGRWLVCLAAHDLYGHESRSASIQLDVQFAPKARIETIPEASQIYEGGYIRLHCASTAHPNDVKLSWSWDGEPRRLEVVDAQTVLINTLRFNDNGRRVTCTAENSVGVGTAVFELDVPFGPRFMSTNQSKVVGRGEQATFQCEVLGNPAPTVRWYHDDRGMDLPLEEGKNITIKDVVDWNQGEYKCVAEVFGFPPKALHHMLFLKGPPNVELSDNFDFDDNSAILSCKVQHRSERAKIHWYYNGHRVDIVEPGISHQDDINGGQQLRHYAVRDERIHRWLVISRLTIFGFSDADYGMYNCTARNEFGVSSAQSEFSRMSIVDTFRRHLNKISPEALVIIGMVSLFSLFIACLTCCCCFCKWRRARRRGHAKLLSHGGKSSTDGDVTCKFEGEVDSSGGTNTSSMAPLCAEKQYFGPQDYHNSSSVYNQSNGGFSHHNPQQQHHQYIGSSDQCFQMPNGSLVGVDQTNVQQQQHYEQQQPFCNSYQSFNNNNNGIIGGTFGRKTAAAATMISPNSFDGMMSVDGGCGVGGTTTVPAATAVSLAFANHASSPYSRYQQPQYYMMETVPEERAPQLRSPDSNPGTFFTNAGESIMVPLSCGDELPHHQQQQYQPPRTLSRNSTHV